MIGTVVPVETEIEVVAGIFAVVVAGTVVVVAGTVAAVAAGTVVVAAGTAAVAAEVAGSVGRPGAELVEAAGPVAGLSAVGSFH